MACEFPDICWKVTLRRKETPLKDRVCPGWVSNVPVKLSLHFLSVFGTLSRVKDILFSILMTLASSVRLRNKWIFRIFSSLQSLV